MVSPLSYAAAAVAVAAAAILLQMLVRDAHQTLLSACASSCQAITTVITRIYRLPGDIISNPTLSTGTLNAVTCTRTEMCLS